MGVIRWRLPPTLLENRKKIFPGWVCVCALTHVQRKDNYTLYSAIVVKNHKLLDLGRKV